MVLGPMLPPRAPTGSALEQLQFSRSQETANRESDRSAAHASARKDAKDSRSEERDERSTGRERAIEKRREGNTVNREIRDAKDGGMQEVSDDVLMGSAGSSSFQSMYVHISF